MDGVRRNKDGSLTYVTDEEAQAEDVIFTDYPQTAKALFDKYSTPTTGEVIQQGVGSFARGLTEIPAGITEGVGLLSESVFGVGADGAHRFANVMRDLTNSVLPQIDKLRDNFFLTDVASGLGSGVGFLAGGAAGMALKLPSMVATGGLGALVGGASGYYDTLYSFEDTDSEEAREKAWQSFLLNGLVGTTEAIPLSRMLERIDKASNGSLAKLLVQSMIEGTEEAIQEGFQTAAGNVIRDFTTDADVEMMEGVLRGAGAGFFSGFILSGVVSARQARVRGQDGVEVDETLKRLAFDERKRVFKRERDEGDGEEGPSPVLEPDAGENEISNAVGQLALETQVSFEDLQAGIKRVAEAEDRQAEILKLGEEWEIKSEAAELEAADNPPAVTTDPPTPVPLPDEPPLEIQKKKEPKKGEPKKKKDGPPTTIKSIPKVKATRLYKGETFEHEGKERKIPPVDVLEVKTGKAFRVEEVFQGRGVSFEKIYAPGVKGPVLGDGEYYALNEEDASTYGEVKRHGIRLDNPYVISSPADVNRVFPEAIPRTIQEMVKFWPEVTRAIKARGHDGVVINIERGTPKVLREAFSHSQVMLFRRTPQGKGGVAEGSPTEAAPRKRTAKAAEKMGVLDMQDNPLSVPQGHFTADISPLLAGKKGHGAFRLKGKDAPKELSKSLRAAQARARATRDGQVAHEADNIFKIIKDLARRLGIAPPGLGKARALKKWAAGFYKPMAQLIRMRRGTQFYTFAHELGHHIHTILFSRAKRYKAIGYDVTTAKPSTALDFPSAWIEDLIILGRDLYGNVIPAGGYATEGWAEVFRFILTNAEGNTGLKGMAHLKKRSPRLYRELMTVLVKEQPELMLVLREAQQRLTNAVFVAERSPYKQTISRGDGDDEKPNWRSRYDRFRRDWTHEWARLTTFKEDLFLEGVLASEDPELAALNAARWATGDVRTMMDRRFDPADARRRRTGKGLREIIEPLGTRLQLFEEYKVARRVLEKRRQGFDVFAPPKDKLGQRSQDDESNYLNDDQRTQEFIERTEEANPDFKQISDEFQEFNEWMIREYAVHFGLLSPMAAEQIIAKNLEYITFRVKKDSDALSSRASVSTSGFANKRSGVRKFDPGKGEQIYPPIESFFANMQTLVTNAHLNRVAQLITQAYEDGVWGAGRWMDRLEDPTEATKIKGLQLKEEVLRQFGVTISKSGMVNIAGSVFENMSEEDAITVLHEIVHLDDAVFFKKGHQVDKSNRELTVMREGKPVIYQIFDSELFEVMEGLHNPYVSHILGKLVTRPRQAIIKTAVRINPSFAFPNFFRDFLQVMTFTEADVKKLPKNARVRFIAMKQAVFEEGEYWELFQAAGVDMSSIFNEYFDSSTLRLDTTKLFAKNQKRFSNPIHGTTAKEIAKDLLEAGKGGFGLEGINNMLEALNRIGEFAVVYESTLTEERSRGRTEEQSQTEAVHRGQQAGADVTLDFQRGGRLAKRWNQIIPFFNAQIIGTAKMGREIKDHPTRTFARIFSYMVVPSMIEFFINYDNEDYWAKPYYERDKYWFIPTGRDDEGNHTYLKVPKPPGIGIFAVFTERSLARMAGIDPGTGKRGDREALKMWDSWMDIGLGSRTSVIGIMREELLPDPNIMGLLPLFEVAAGGQGYSLWLDRPIVSSADRDLPAHMQGQARSTRMSQVLGQAMGVAPAKLDYLLHSYTGGLVRDIGNLPIFGGRGKTGEPLEFADYMVVRRFFAGETQGSHQAIRRFYDVYDHLKGVRTAEGRLSGEELSDWVKEHRASLSIWPSISKVQRKIGEDFRLLRKLYSLGEDGMDPMDRSKRIDDTFSRIITKAQRALQMEESASK